MNVPMYLLALQVHGPRFTSPSKYWVLDAKSLELLRKFLGSCLQHSFERDKYWLSSRGGLEVEQWSVNRTLSISVDRIPLEACM